MNVNTRFLRTALALAVALALPLAATTAVAAPATSTTTNYEFRWPVAGLQPAPQIVCTPDGAPASGWTWPPPVTVSVAGITAWRAPALPAGSADGGCNAWYVGVEDVSAAARGGYLGMEHHPIAPGAAAFGASDVSYLTGAPAYQAGDQFAISYYLFQE